MSTVGKGVFTHKKQGEARKEEARAKKKKEEDKVLISSWLGWLAFQF